MVRIVRLAMVATVIVVAAILSFGSYKARGQGQVCQGDVSALTALCGPYVRKGSPQVEPSQGCCGIIKQTDVQCMCEHLPPGADTVIDMGKVLYICKACGKPLKSGSTCGGGNGLTDKASTT